MKTRIKIIEYEDGRKEYIPQYKSLVTWPGWWDVDPFGNVDTSCLENVKKSIDEFLFRNREECRKPVPKPKVSYIKYP